MKRGPELIGQIFVEMGLISPNDVSRALIFQQERGGYFGDALIAMGLLTQDQVKWGLAVQYDVPFVHLRPENIDRAVAAMVPVDWAREHLILPVLRHGNTVTAILTTPASAEELDEVRRFTRADRIELAVSTAATIKELIASVHDFGGRSVGFSEWISEVLAVGAREIGLSARGDAVHAWYRIGKVVNRQLENGWAADLRKMIAPFPDLQSERVQRWPGILTAPNGSWRVECSAVGTKATLEWVAQIGPAIPTSLFRLRPDAEIQASFDKLATRGKAVIKVGADGESVTPELLEVLLPRTAALLAGPDVRAVHIADRPVAALPEVLLLSIETSLAELLASLAPFGFAALTLDVERLSASDLAAAQKVAPLIAYRCRSGEIEDLEADMELYLRMIDGRLIWTHHEAAHAAD